VAVQEQPQAELEAPVVAAAPVSDERHDGYGSNAKYPKEVVETEGRMVSRHERLSELPGP